MPKLTTLSIISEAMRNMVAELHMETIHQDP